MRRGLGEVLAGGSRVRVGFAVAQIGNAIPLDVIKADLEGCLYNTGMFNSVEMIYYQNYGDDYLEVRAETADDFAEVDHYGQLVAQQLQLCAPALTIYRRDAVAIDSRPLDRPDAAAVRDTQGNFVCGPGEVIANDFLGRPYCRKIEIPGQPKKCDMDQLGFTKWIACQLGFSASTANTVLIFGGVILIAALFRRR